MSRKKKYDWDFMRPFDAEAEQDYTLEWQLATLRARDGKPGELAKLLRATRPVPDQTLQFLSNFLEVLEARKLGALYDKPLYSEDDHRHIAAARDFYLLETEIPEADDRLDFVVEKHGIQPDKREHQKRTEKIAYAGSETPQYSKLKAIIEQRGRDWQRLRHLFLKD